MRDMLNDMQLYLVDEYVEDYQEGLITRRQALKRIAAVSGSLAFATTTLAACGEPTANTSTPNAAAVGSPTAVAVATGTTAATAWSSTRTARRSSP